MIQIGDSRLMLSQARDEFKPLPLALHLYVEDCDATYAAALEAGLRAPWSRTISSTVIA